jgi:hypothetical protein
MIKATGETDTPDPKAFDRFADIARKVFAAPKADVEKQIGKAGARRKAKRERETRTE